MASSSYSYVTGGAGNQKTLTLSGWFKVCKQVSGGCFFSYYYASTTARSEVFLGTTNELKVGICPDGSTWKELTYPNKMRDPAAWYNLVVAYDTTESVEADRVKVYINGNQITATSGDYPSLNEDTGWFASGYQQTIGRYESGDASYVDGCVTHVNFIEGTAYAPTAFGEFDATSGIWIAKSGPSVTYGDEGGFWKFASGALTTDSSGNSNTLTAVGTPTECKDSPDNNFCTMNALDTNFNDATFSNGNNTVVTGSSKYSPNLSTIGMTSGKWYWECKPTAGSSPESWLIGVSSTESTATANELGHYANDWGYYGSGTTRNNNTNTAYGDAYVLDDVIGVALDLTNNKLYFSKNGTWQNSGVPTSGGTGTGAISITAAGSTPLNVYRAAICYYDTGTGTISTNFGNGYFGTTSSGTTEADDAGIGQFKYDVPAGYYALCTNNLGDQS